MICYSNSSTGKAGLLGSDSILHLHIAGYLLPVSYTIAVLIVVQTAVNRSTDSMLIERVKLVLHEQVQLKSRYNAQVYTLYREREMSSKGRQSVAPPRMSKMKIMHGIRKKINIERNGRKEKGKETGRT